MQTAFRSEQLAQPDIAEADAILRTCVHYGFCTGTCPTYVLLRDENDSPRGRIDLIKAMLEKGGSPEAKTVHHLDRCLSCFACMPTCAVRVDYARLIDIARVYIERNFRRPVSDRLLRRLLSLILPYTGRFRAALRAAKLAQPFARMLPARVGNLIGMASAWPGRAELLRPQTYRTQGERRMRVALLAGCAQQALDRNINAATLRLLQRHGCEVVVAQGAGCCGALPLHMGYATQATKLAKANVEAWSKLLDDGLDAIVINASGCGATVKDYGRLLNEEKARRIGALARDVTEIVAQLGLRPSGAMKPYRVAYHDACSLQHAQRITEPPRRLLTAAGFEVVPVPETHFCCGSAGTYNLLQPEIAGALGRRKAAHVESVDADIVAAGNLGCMVQIGRYAKTPIVHTAELLDWASGGPTPERLRGRRLREPAQRKPIISITPIATPPDDPGIW